MNYCFSALAKTLISTIMLLCGILGVCAQNNVYSINDRLYPLYIKAHKHRKSALGLVLADSLRKEAIAIGDRKAELAALAIPVHHYFYNQKGVEFYQGVTKKLMDKSKEYGDLMYYYMAVSNMTSYLMSSGRYIEAFNYQNEQIEIAKKNGYIRGVASGYRMLGVIHQYRGELMMAIERFRQSIDYSSKNLTNYNVAPNYMSISNCYRMMNDFDEMLKVTEEGRVHVQNFNHPTRYNILLQLCYAKFMTGRYKEFEKDYEYLKTHPVDVFTGTVVVRDAVKAQKAILDGRDDDFWKIVEEIRRDSQEEECRLLVEYYKLRNDPQKSLKYAKELFSLRNIINVSVIQEDAKSMEMIYKNKELEEERQRSIFESAKLELANTKLRLDNSELELLRTTDAANLASLTAERNRLSLRNQKLKSNQLSDSLLQQRLRLNAEEHRMRSKSIMLTTIVCVVILIIIMSFVYAMRNRKMSKKLRESNGELQQLIGELNEIKEQAREAEKLKTMFVQNMSHEIRTPLNAIVGFSQVLLDMESDLDAEEKKNVTKMIADNSELLTALVNDIFELTNLSSGSYKMVMTKVKVNTICREAIETVRHRKAEGVDLIFKTELPDDYTTVTDMRRVAQVLINMLTNAEKNTTEGSITLLCSLSEHPGMITFSVADTGIGVPKDKMEEIFKRFKKLNNQKQGTGLGLDICRTIAGKLGGEINIDPDYTGGARFWFTIPENE